MLIVLDDSIESIVRTNNLTEGQSSALQDIASSIRRGRHALTALSFGVIDELSKSECLSDSTKDVYVDIYKRWSQHKDLHKKVSKRLLVGVFNEDKELRIERNGNIPMNLESLNKFDLLEGTALVLENQNDDVIYKFIFKSIVHKIMKKNYTAYWEIHHGGGNTTGDVYSRIQEKNNTKMVLCIVDSDKKFPDNGYGETANKVKKANDKENIFSDYHVIDAHEVENLIPLSLYYEFMETISSDDSIDDNISLLDIYNKMYDTEKDFLQRYFDYKNGIQCKELNCSKNKIDPQFKDDFKNNWLSIVNYIAPIKLKCNYKECNKPGCEEHILPILLKRIRRKEIRDYIKNKKPIELDSRDPLYKEWNIIAKQILDWCFNFPPSPKASK